ncbi:MAG: PQQ-binding-like beta-propeller repeat protein [Planctomycetaceae bacterium]
MRNPVWAWLFCVSLTAPATGQPDQPLQNWHQWRGPFANGTAATTATPPTEWSTDRNVRWTVDVPGQGTGTPIVWGDRVFVLSAKPTDRKAENPPQASELSKTVPPDVYYQFIVSCVSRATGEILWQKIAIEEVPHEGHHPTHTYAGGSPTTDGQRLYASFGSRGIFAYSLDGDLLWKTDLGDMRTRYGWGEAVTPVIQDDSLIINWDQEEGSFITCLNAATGEPRWKTARPTEVTSWNTPLVTSFGDDHLVVVNGTGKVRAYMLSSGREVWACGGQTVNAIPSPVRFRDNVIAMSGYRGAMAASIPLDSSGDVTGSKSLTWQYHSGTPYVPSPLLHKDRLFFTGGNGNILTVLDAATGQPIREASRLSSARNFYASPVFANGHIYFLDRNGTCVVLSADSLDVVAVNQLNDATDASPVAVDQQLFLRSWTRLYCIAK